MQSQHRRESSRQDVNEKIGTGGKDEYRRQDKCPSTREVEAPEDGSVRTSGERGDRGPSVRDGPKCPAQ